MNTEKPTIGLAMWRRKRQYDRCEEVVVVPMQWNDRDGHPSGMFSTSVDRDHFDELHFGGYVSDFMSDKSPTEAQWPYFYGSEARYRDIYELTAGKAMRCAKFLAKVERAIDKADAHEHGDKFMVFAKCCGASEVWMAKAPDYKIASTGLSGTSWVKLTITEGRDRYRRLIADAREDTRKLLLPNERKAEAA